MLLLSEQRHFMGNRTFPPDRKFYFSLFTFFPSVSEAAQNKLELVAGLIVRPWCLLGHLNTCKCSSWNGETALMFLTVWTYDADQTTLSSPDVSPGRVDLFAVSLTACGIIWRIVLTLRFGDTCSGSVKLQFEEHLQGLEEFDQCAVDSKRGWKGDFSLFGAATHPACWYDPKWHCVLLLRKLWNTIGCYCDLKLWLTPGFFERLEHEKVTFCMAPLNTLKLLYKNMSWLWGFGRFGRMNGRVCSARLGHCSGLMSDSCFTLS